MMFYTYAHSKPQGKIFYIGKGQGNRAWDKRSRNAYWWNITNKHGYDVQIIAHWNTEKEAFNHETLLISCFKDMGYSLANLTNGGEGQSGYQHTEETKQKISNSSLGTKNHFFGKKHTNKTKTILSLKRKEKIAKNGLKFKGTIVATNTKTGEEIKIKGRKELISFGFLHPSNVYACLNGRIKTYKQHTFVWEKL